MQKSILMLAKKKKREAVRLMLICPCSLVGRKTLQEVIFFAVKTLNWTFSKCRVGVQHSISQGLETYLNIVYTVLHLLHLSSKG